MQITFFSHDIVLTSYTIIINLMLEYLYIPLLVIEDVYSLPIMKSSYEYNPPD